MGKTTANSRLNPKAKAQQKMLAKLNLNVSLEELVSRAQEYIDYFQYEEAQVLCKEALKNNPDYVPALELSASLCLELGNEEGAKHCYGRAITLQPENGHTKYLAMAELLNGKESFQCYRKGVQLMLVTLDNLLNSTQNNTDTQPHSSSDITSVAATTTTTTISEEMDESLENGPSDKITRNDEAECSVATKLKDELTLILTLKRDIAGAYCAIAELYMTDLCDEEEAEKNCGENIDAAIQIDCDNPEPYQQMASFFLVKQDKEAAKEQLKKSVALWLPKYKAIDDGLAAAGTFDPVDMCPLSYSSRISTSRLLIEVGEHKLAEEVLESLLVEDEDVAETWYLLGWNYHLLGEGQKWEAKRHLIRALRLHDQDPDEEDEMLSHTKKLLEELGYVPGDDDSSSDNVDDYEDCNDDFDADSAEEDDKGNMEME